MTALDKFLEEVEGRVKGRDAEVMDYYGIPNLIAIVRRQKEAIGRVHHNASYGANKAHTARDREVFEIIFNDARACNADVERILKDE